MCFCPSSEGISKRCSSSRDVHDRKACSVSGTRRTLETPKFPAGLECVTCPASNKGNQRARSTINRNDNPSSRIVQQSKLHRNTNGTIIETLGCCTLSCWLTPWKMFLVRQLSFVEKKHIGLEIDSHVEVLLVPTSALLHSSHDRSSSFDRSLT